MLDWYIVAPKSGIYVLLLQTHYIVGIRHKYILHMFCYDTVNAFVMMTICRFTSHIMTFVERYMAIFISQLKGEQLFLNVSKSVWTIAFIFNFPIYLRSIHPRINIWRHVSTLYQPRPPAVIHAKWCNTLNETSK